jgi:DNA invertase Pin-like site-specific DNA recombinase
MAVHWLERRERRSAAEALAACRAGDTLAVTKLDRLARSLPDARAIAEDLTRRKVRLNLGGSVYAPTDPVGRLLFNDLAMVAEIRSRSARMPHSVCGRPPARLTCWMTSMSMPPVPQAGS